MDKMTVARFVAAAIENSGKTQRQIADEVGYENANIITMLKQGTTKVPFNKVGPLSKAMGVDPVHFLRLVLNEYVPDTWSAIAAILPGELVSENERAFLTEVRERSGYWDPALHLATTPDGVIVKGLES
jgi:hypothetical protein